MGIVFLDCRVTHIQLRDSTQSHRRGAIRRPSLPSHLFGNSHHERHKKNNNKTMSQIMTTRTKNKGEQESNASLAKRLEKSEKMGENVSINGRDDNTQRSTHEWTHNAIMERAIDGKQSSKPCSEF